MARTPSIEEVTAHARGWDADPSDRRWPHDGGPRRAEAVRMVRRARAEGLRRDARAAQHPALAVLGRGRGAGRVPGRAGPGAGFGDAAGSLRDRWLDAGRDGHGAPG